MGRVRVKFPALGDNIEGWWARVATINAAKDRGLFMLPQPWRRGRGRVRARRPAPPFVLGSLYTGKDKVPDDLHDQQERKSGVRDQVRPQAPRSRASRRSRCAPARSSIDRGQPGRPQRYRRRDARRQGQDRDQRRSDGHISGATGVTVESRGPLKLSGASVDINAVGAVNVSGAVINLGRHPRLGHRLPAAGRPPRRPRAGARRDRHRSGDRADPRHRAGRAADASRVRLRRARLRVRHDRRRHRRAHGDRDPRRARPLGAARRGHSTWSSTSTAPPPAGC